MSDRSYFSDIVKLFAALQVFNVRLAVRTFLTISGEKVEILTCRTIKAGTSVVCVRGCIWTLFREDNSFLSEFLFLSDVKIKILIVGDNVIGTNFLEIYRVLDI